MRYALLNGMVTLISLFLLLDGAHAEVAASNSEMVRSIPSANASEVRAWDGERQKVIAHLSKTSVKSVGPNCWNSALLVSGLTDSVRYTDKSEFWYWMNSPFCKALPPDAALQYGDIGSVFTEGEGNFHSFMRMNDDLIFQKPNPKPDSGWSVYNYETILLPQFFNEATRCKGNELAINQNKCPFQVLYHRCNPVPRDFYSRHQDLGEIEAAIKSSEANMLDWMQSHSKAKLKIYKTEMLNLQGLLRRLRSMRFTGQKEFAREALVLRTAGLMYTDGEMELKSVNDARVDANRVFDRYPSRIEPGDIPR